MTETTSIVFSDNWNLYQRRLITFAEDVVNKVTKAALKESASYMKDQAVIKVHTSTHEHKLKVDGVYVPIQPGTLAKNIRYKVLRKNQLDFGTQGYKVYVSAKFAWYAMFVEYGTSKMAPEPFMSQAFEENFEILSRIFKEMIDMAIDDGGL